MTQHIYAFGSICRGEVDKSSDVDLLAIVDGFDQRFDPNEYSIYSYSRINELWREGNPFAWHLYLEARLIYADDGSDYLRSQPKPSTYKRGLLDCKKFRDVFQSAKESLNKTNLTETFDISSMFLSVRNLATCYSLARCSVPDFSRSSALRLNGESIPLNEKNYRILERARLLCTRGDGELLNTVEIGIVKRSIPLIEDWMSMLIKKVENS